MPSGLLVVAQRLEFLAREHVVNWDESRGVPPRSMRHASCDPSNVRCGLSTGPGLTLGVVDAHNAAWNRLSVYRLCKSRTNLGIDDDAVAEVMRRFRFTTKREAVNFALKALAAEPMPLEQARAMRGSGWEGDLDQCGKCD